MFEKRCKKCGEVVPSTGKKGRPKQYCTKCKGKHKVIKAEESLGHIAKVVESSTARDVEVDLPFKPWFSSDKENA